MRPQPFSELTLLAHQDAILTRAVATTELEVERLLRVALCGPSKRNLRDLRSGKATPGIVVGSELYRGYTRHPVTRKLRNHLKRKLANDLDFFLYAVERLGYVTPLVRAGLEHHFVTLATSPITSDGFLVYTDLSVALSRVGETKVSGTTTVKAVAGHLAAGYTPVELGERLGVNGPDAVSAAVRILSNHLEGRG
jgi:hypothetical protein